jgi:hypothetical protein
MTFTLLQSMRLDTDFRDFIIIGCQYKNENQSPEWHLAVWSERDNKVRRYWMVAGMQPDIFATEDLEAVRWAIARWEANPVWVQ